jgi:hypothetical protein
MSVFVRFFTGRRTRVGDDYALIAIMGPATAVQAAAISKITGAHHYFNTMKPKNLPNRAGDGLFLS